MNTSASNTEPSQPIPDKMSSLKHSASVLEKVVDNLHTRLGSVLGPRDESGYPTGSEDSSDQSELYNQLDDLQSRLIHVTYTVETILSRLEL